jgi:hypothetical protein
MKEYVKNYMSRIMAALVSNDAVSLKCAQVMFTVFVAIMPSVQNSLTEQLRVQNRRVELGFFMLYKKYAFDMMTELITSNYGRYNVVSLVEYYVTTMQHVWKCQDHASIYIFQDYALKRQATEKAIVETSQTKRQQNKRWLQSQKKKSLVGERQKINDGSKPVLLPPSAHHTISLLGGLD